MLRKRRKHRYFSKIFLKLSEISLKTTAKVRNMFQLKAAEKRDEEMC